MGEIIQISSSPSQEVVSQPDNDSPPLSSQEIERLLEVTPSQAEAAAAPDDAPEDPVEEFKIKCNKEVAAHASKIEEFIQKKRSQTLIATKRGEEFSKAMTKDVVKNWLAENKEVVDDIKSGNVENWRHTNYHSSLRQKTLLNGRMFNIGFYEHVWDILYHELWSLDKIWSTGTFDPEEHSYIQKVN